MASSLYAWLCGVTVLEFIGATWFTLHPISGVLDKLQTWRGWQHLYTFGCSNLDVWALSLLKTAILLLIVVLVEPEHRPAIGAPTQTNKKQVQRAASAVISATQLLLLAKSVAVAVLSPPEIWPPRYYDTGEVGLALMFSSIILVFLSTLVQSWLVPAVVNLRAAARKRPGSRLLGGAEQEPLLPTSSAAAAEQKEAGQGGNGSKEDAEEQDQEHVDRRTVGELLHLSAPDAPLLGLAFLTGVVASLGQALIPHYTGLIIDYASVEGDRAHFHSALITLVLVALGTALFTGGRGGMFIVTMARLNVRLRTRLFHSLLLQDIAFFDKNRTGDISSRLSSDTSKVADQVGLNLNVMLRSITLAFTVLVFMFRASWRLTIVTFILVPVTLLICKVYGKYWREVTKKVQSELADANSVAEEALSSMPTVKSHAAQDSTEAAYAAKLAEFYVVQVKASGAYTLWAVANTFLPNCVAAVVLFYGGTLVFRGEMSRGNLIAFILYQQSLSGAFQMVGDVFSALMGALGAADKVMQLMRRQPEIHEDGELVPATFEGCIELRDVHFSYPSRPTSLVLTGMSLTVNPGEVVALVGPSGGGKSSVMKLVERFYLPQRGTVVLDGRDIGVYEGKWLRRKVALVAQEPVLYARSIRRNIIYGLEPQDGCTPPSQEEIEGAAAQANAAEFIAGFPEGYDTGCGEKGVALSGGQKQRIAIARALVRRPGVLLLDEATSALDAESEAVVQEALDRVMRGRTVLVIAHRLSTVQNADRIIVVGHGTVQETGTHEQLLEAGGVYASLVRRQLSRVGSSATLPRLGGLTPSPSFTALPE